jgi:hypothetical protein
MHNIAIAKAEFQNPYWVPKTVDQLDSLTSSVPMHLNNKLSVFKWDIYMTLSLIYIMYIYKEKKAIELRKNPFYKYIYPQ